MEAGELLSRYRAGERCFSEVDLRLANLRQCKLSGVDLRRANLNEADLRGADLSSSILEYANLSYANLSQANLTWSNLSQANFSQAMMASANLSRASAFMARFNRANLSHANLQNADISEAGFRLANLQHASLCKANANAAKFYHADLFQADLDKTLLRNANLNGANLSGAKNLLNVEEWLMAYFKLTAAGFVVYKSFGHTRYAQPWTVEEGAVIEEVVNQDPTEDCGCGVNFGTLEFVQCSFADSQIRECILPPFVQVVVPYNTSGKARCAKLIVGKVVE